MLRMNEITGLVIGLGLPREGMPALLEQRRWFNNQSASPLEAAPRRWTAPAGTASSRP
ncbi:hypothetical protein WMF39_35090 [Sorangium sp. So ce1504]|uniref:hypothetical protein n=1 Tax=Sorangium sp. So ce1504 TaxID=3133337 RepID=UPI003F63ED10